jgi:hypothetical protein
MISCIDVVNDLTRTIDIENTKLIQKMISQKVEYDYVCVQPNITFDSYFKCVKTSWEKIINDYVKKTDKCSSGTQNILFMYELLKNINDKDVIDKVIDAYNVNYNVNFVMDENMVVTMKNMARILGDHCKCQMIDIFTFVVNKYKSKYQQKLKGKSRQEVQLALKKDYEYVKNELTKYAAMDPSNVKLTSGTSILNFSVENELGRLIPDSMGPIKEFFIKVISAYYNNLHPVIWSQIFKSISKNLFVELPLSPNEMFSFISKHLLLNSGPFILKIVQLIRPALSPKIKAKYNLASPKYPLLTDEQVDVILRQVMNNYEMIKIITNISASVGHVCICYDVRKPEDVLVVKIIKPLAIAQSCWEYKILSDVYPKNSCESAFLKNMLRSNGEEMNVNNEIANLIKGFAEYTSDYNNEFGINVDAKLSTIEYRDDVIKPGAWFVLSTTLALGIPLSNLIDSKLIENDTKYRANLHRCLDILVSKFFYVLIRTGFYHGDLHPGNVFYSFKNKQITMIDFGSMGNVNLFNNDPSMFGLLTVILMSTFYNFDGMLDTLTDILNSKCKNDANYTFINKKTEEYRAFKKQLKKYKIINIVNQKNVKEKSNKYIHDLLDAQRMNAEMNVLPQETKEDITDEHEKSIYDYLERPLASKETIVENVDILPVFTDVKDDQTSITFEQIIKMIIEFYASNGINVVIKFSELSQLQKAYSLLLGILKDSDYSSYRMAMAIRTGVLRWGSLVNVVSNPSTAVNLVDVYWNESKKYDSIKSQLREYVPEL